MNMGSAVRSHEFDAVHMEVASTWPAGVATFVSTAAKPHTASAIAIHTPEPRMANRSRISSSDSSTTHIASAFLAERDRILGGTERGPAPHCNHEQLVDQRDRQDERAERHRCLRIDQRHADDARRHLMEQE